MPWLLSSHVLFLSFWAHCVVSQLVFAVLCETPFIGPFKKVSSSPISMYLLGFSHLKKIWQEDKKLKL